MKLYADEPYYLNKINKNAVYTNSVQRSIEVEMLDNLFKNEKLSPNSKNSKSVVKFNVD